MKCVCVLALCLFMFALPAVAAGARFGRYEGKLAYGLLIHAPWADGGHYVINFPEHMPYERFSGRGGGGILSHNEKAPRLGWTVSTDGMSATLDVENPRPYLPGVRVEAEAKVVSKGRVEYVMRITNGSKFDFSNVLPLFCHHYGDLTGFPPAKGGQDRTHNFTHTYVLSNGEVTAVSELKTERAKPKVKGANVKGCRFTSSMRFSRSRGGMFEEGIDAAITAITAEDGERKMVIAASPGRDMLTNPSIPCIHADPYFGPILVGKTGEVKGVLIFTEEPLEVVMKRLQKEGWGAPQEDKPGDDRAE